MQDGDITEPSVPQTPSLRYASHPLNASPPELAQSADDIFCKTCIHNQHIYHQTLANYLPDPSDARYHEYERNLPAYKADLEKRYPQICANCVPRANQRLKAATYAAQSDHVRRQLLKTKSASHMPSAGRNWDWRLAALSLVGVLWWIGLAIQVIWNVLALLPLSEQRQALKSDTLATQAACSLHALLSRELEPDCLAAVSQTGKYGIMLSLVCIWYHPLLSTRLQSSNAKINGYFDNVILQAATVGLRALNWWLVDRDRKDLLASEKDFRSVHAVVLVFMLLSSTLCITMVRVNKPALFSFSQRIPEIEAPRPSSGGDLKPSGSNSEQTAGLFARQPQAPFPIHKLSGTGGQGKVLDNLESLRQNRRSFSMKGSDSDSEYDDSNDDGRSVATAITHQSMDWEPTTTHTTINPTPTFAARLNLAMGNHPESPFAQSGTTSSGGAFGRSPFHGTLPAAPESPAARLRKPRQPAFKKTGEITQQNWFRDFRTATDIGAGHSDEDEQAEGQRGYGRHAAVFQSPRFKYGQPQPDTGLEDMFGAAIKLSEGPPTPHARRRSSHKNVTFDVRPRSEHPPKSSFSTAINWRACFGLLLVLIAAVIPLGLLDPAIAKMQDYLSSYVHR